MRKSAYLLAILLLCTLWACDSYDSWTVDPSARLTFSSDTVSFDTIISKVGSSTRRLLVFNNNSAGIRLTNVRLKHGAESYFRINVDGQFLEQGSGYDFEVRGRDSIFVLVEVTLPDVDADTVTSYTDSLAFQAESGEVQYVTLLAGGRDAYHWYGTIDINEDRTIPAGRPVVIYDSVHVASDATLTLAPGAVLMFHHNAAMRVDGKLVANGTVDNPVIMRGDRTDNLFSYLPYDNTPEQWGGLYLHGGPHSLDYLDRHLRILSGFYGVLAPRDGVVPYRLEMQAKLALPAQRGHGATSNLYEYWGDTLAHHVAQQFDVVVNVASVEYAKAVTPYLAEMGVRVLTCLFGTVRPSDGRLVQRSTEAKAARGDFVRWCAEHAVEATCDLDGFDDRGYHLDPARSDADTLSGPYYWSSSFLSMIWKLARWM